ncbi:uncharacterized protein LOC62_01G001027 [Vanrija pseudolonga]|uniref:Uncharacterized protein n=1 Tax=Vanrija pseudolonga TaxID=143232 RepID=A0AAF0Y3F0_9TREE|nr:hypothetical protein LOC62_01G001027 [Vanrija pseudolonga]
MGQVHDRTTVTQDDTMGGSKDPLPGIIIDLILECLDVNRDRSTFINLLCVSDLWEMTAVILYKNIDINGDQLCKLLVSSTAKSTERTTEVETWAEFVPPLHDRHWPLSPVSEDRLRQYQLPRPGRELNDLSIRTRRALSFIWHLSIRNLTERAVDLITDSTLPYTVLFPNVTKLHLSFTTLIPMFPGEVSSVGIHGAVRRAFDTLDLCVWELQANNTLARDGGPMCPYADWILPRLSIDKLQTMSIHSNRILQYNGCPYPDMVQGALYWFINDTRALCSIGRSRPGDVRVKTVKSVRCLVGSPGNTGSMVVTKANVKLANKAQQHWAGLAESAAPMNVTGPWDETGSPLHQFRADTPEHLPCCICGAKFDFGQRSSDQVWTTTKG